MNKTPTNDPRELYRRSSRIGYTPGSYYTPEDVNVVAERGLGARFWDVQGKCYIDYLLGSGPAILGYAHPAVNAAMAEQISRGAHFYVQNRHAIELGEKLCKIIPCAEEVRYLLSGTEAAATAMRMARAFTGREKIMKFEGSFHGTGDYAMMSAWNPSKGYPVPTPDSPGIPACVTDTVLVAPWNDFELAESVLRKHAHEIAALICEPVQRIVPPVPGFLEMLRRVTRELGILLIFDEMVTGFRMSLGGGQAYYEVTPDMAIIGKALTNGLPMTAVVGRSDLIGLARPAEVRDGAGVYFGGTLNGNSLSCAAALATIRELEKPGVYTRLEHVVNRLRDGLIGAAARHGLPFQTVGVNTFFHTYFSDRPIQNRLDVIAASSPLQEIFYWECLKRGVLQQRGKFYVAAVTSEEDVADSLQVFEDAMKATAANA